jgi:hypothetical protein
MEKGVLQPDGRRMPESIFDVAHVAAAVVHIAGLPPDVAVPQFTIMSVHFLLACAVVSIPFRASKAPFAGRG